MAAEAEFGELRQHRADHPAARPLHQLGAGDVAAGDSGSLDPAHLGGGQQRLGFHSCLSPAQIAQILGS